jgi:hypothetical protein
VKSGNFTNFPLFGEITSDSVHPVEPKVRDSVITHLDNMKTTTGRIIPTGSVADIWVTIPFTVSLDQISDAYLAKGKLIDFSNNQKPRFDSESMKLDRFWRILGEVYLILTKRA